ncbi:DUF58 domain-containing protein [Thalassotalea sp. PLHSN55]|uniref:DUF58 domain-containing protein n=1 Tax=Thalassotalea sp. PLHSN55 TaxID=3435888 RepID=UPI003F84BCA1
MRRTAFRPSKKALLTLGLMLFLCIIVKLLSEEQQVTDGLTFIVVAVLSIALLDLIKSKTLPKLRIKRVLPTQLSFNHWHIIKYQITNTGTTNLILALRDHVSSHFNLKGFTRNETLAANEELLVQGKIQPLQRGAANIGPIEICLHSPWKIWQSYWLIDDVLEVKTYPNFERLRQQQLYGVSNLPINGLKQRKKRGSGTEFHQLRDFRQGDSIRQIDWQATSKRQKLIAKEYQEERNQQIIVMLDAGHKMNIETDIGSHFDAALNALLMLSHTVLKQGDWFSMQSFNQHERWLPAVKGAQNVSQVMNHFYDLQPDEYASDYNKAVNSLLTKRSKRALVLVVTTLSEESFDDLLPALKNLQRHHLVALINIENVALTQTLNADINQVNDANRYCAAVELKNSYNAHLKRIEKAGIICVNCQPQYLLTYVINTYLNVKHAGML